MWVCTQVRLFPGKSLPHTRSGTKQVLESPHLQNHIRAFCPGSFMNVFTKILILGLLAGLLLHQHQVGDFNYHISISRLFYF